MKWSETVWRCDQCLEIVRVRVETVVVAGYDRIGALASLPRPWREFPIIGAVGVYTACSDDCEDQIRARYERPEPETLRPPAFSKSVRLSIASCAVALSWLEGIELSTLEPDAQGKLREVIDEMKSTIRREAPAEET